MKVDRGRHEFSRFSALVTHEKGLPAASDALLHLAVLMPDTQTADAVASSLRLSRRTQRLRAAPDHRCRSAQRPQHYFIIMAPCVSDQAVMALADGQFRPRRQAQCWQWPRNGWHRVFLYAALKWPLPACLKVRRWGVCWPSWKTGGWRRFSRPNAEGNFTGAGLLGKLTSGLLRPDDSEAR